MCQCHDWVWIMKDETNNVWWIDRLDIFYRTLFSITVIWRSLVFFLDRNLFFFLGINLEKVKMASIAVWLLNNKLSFRNAFWWWQQFSQLIYSVISTRQQLLLSGYFQFISKFIKVVQIKIFSFTFDNLFLLLHRGESWQETLKIWLYLKCLVCNTLFKS